jgi:hypothetical protein
LGIFEIFEMIGNVHGTLGLEIPEEIDEVPIKIETANQSCWTLNGD